MLNLLFLVRESLQYTRLKVMYQMHHYMKNYLWRRNVVRKFKFPRQMGLYGEEIDFVGKEYSMSTKLYFLAQKRRFGEEMNISSLKGTHLATKLSFLAKKLI